MKGFIKNLKFTWNYAKHSKKQLYETEIKKINKRLIFKLTTN